MSTSRISPNALRNQTNRAIEDIEKQKADAAEELRALKRALSTFGKQSLLEACEGHTLLKLPTNATNDLINSVKKLGFTVISSTSAKDQLEEFQSNKNKYEESIHRILSESELVQAFIAKAPTDNPDEDSFSKLLSLLEQTESYRQRSGDSNSRDYFVKHLENARHWINGKGNIPSKGIYGYLEDLWTNFIWLHKTTFEIGKHKRVLGQLTGNGTFASWHSVQSEAKFGNSQAPTPNFLRWLSATEGQKFLDAIDARMAAKSSIGLNTLKIALIESDGDYYWKPDLTTLQAVSPECLSKLMKIRGFGVVSVDQDTLEISW